MFKYIKAVAYSALYMSGFFGAKIAGFFGASRAVKQAAAVAWTLGMVLLVGPLFLAAVVTITTVTVWAASYAIAAYFKQPMNTVVDTIMDIVVDFN